MSNNELSMDQQEHLKTEINKDSSELPQHNNEDDGSMTSPINDDNLQTALEQNFRNFCIDNKLGEDENVDEPATSEESDCEDTAVGLNVKDYPDNYKVENSNEAVNDMLNGERLPSLHKFYDNEVHPNSILADSDIQILNEQDVSKINNDLKRDTQPVKSTLSAKAPEFKPQRINPFNKTKNLSETSEEILGRSELGSTPASVFSEDHSSPKYHPMFELMPSKTQGLGENSKELRNFVQEAQMKPQSSTSSPLNSASSPWVQRTKEHTDVDHTDNKTHKFNEHSSQYHKEDYSSTSNHLPTSESSHTNNEQKVNRNVNGDTNRDTLNEGSSTSCSNEAVYAPGPCEPEDLIEGIIFTANYLGSTQLMSEKNPAKSSRMFQAQEAVSRIKAPDGENQPSVEVDLFISTAKVKVLNADTQETMMEHFLRSISYIADIGQLLVVMARRRPPQGEQEEEDMIRLPNKQEKRNRIICHVFSSPDTHLMAQAIGQAFNVAYQQFLRANGIEPQTLTQDDFNTILDTQEMYHDDLVHYSKQENIKELWIEKEKGEGLGIVVVESGWGSILPTVVLANMQHGGAVERSGKMRIGDQIMSINSTSLVGLPLQTCHSILKGVKNHTLVKINIVSCPPVVTVLIKRPDLKYQLGFSVQNGIICSLMRGGIAERGGVRVGHRIIEINTQSVVATPHDRIVQMLVTSVGEIQMKTMPAAMYRLLTGQEQPVYI